MSGCINHKIMILNINHSNLAHFVHDPGRQGSASDDKCTPTTTGMHCDSKLLTVANFNIGDEVKIALWRDDCVFHGKTLDVVAETGMTGKHLICYENDIGWS